MYVITLRSKREKSPKGVQASLDVGTHSNVRLLSSVEVFSGVRDPSDLIDEQSDHPVPASGGDHLKVKEIKSPEGVQALSDVGTCSNVRLLSRVEALSEVRDSSDLRDPSENGLPDHPVVDGAENAAKTRGTSEKYHGPIGQETSSSEEGEVLAQVLLLRRASNLI